MAKKKTLQSEENLDKNEQQNTLRVEIVSNKSLFDILGDTKRVWKIILVLFILVFTIFVALAFVTIAIKKIYPYNDIKVNALGATTMQNEDKEIIYWLFNTADLWANSGIKVEKGDILTIRASGRSHTAIHHLVRDANDNKKLDDSWVSTDGEGKKTTVRDSLRAQYRIFKNKAQDALLMQVIPEDIEMREDIQDSYRTFEYLSNNNNSYKEQQTRDNYYYIGKEREDLLIHNDGVLHFAVNDIVLTDIVINKMITENDSLIRIDSHQNLDSIWEEGNEKHFKFGPYPEPGSAKHNKAKHNKNEMNYYLEKHYYNAWYDDNVGSFLIVIERKSKK
jgi:hypothetical protein